jgi:hypothetical protein
MHGYYFLPIVSYNTIVLDRYKISGVTSTVNVFDKTVETQQISSFLKKGIRLFT